MGGHVLELLHDSGRPADFHQVRGLARAQTEVGGTGARRSVSGSERNVIVLGDSACHHLESCPHAIAVAFRAFQRELDPVIAARGQIKSFYNAKKVIRTINMGKISNLTKEQNIV